MNEMTVKTSDGDMRICVMNITPKKAVEFLTMNTNNRNLRPERVNVYASEMKSGNWKANGIPIIFGNDGKLKDGQHRLQACVKSNKIIKNALVVYLPQTQTNCYDIGLSRTAKDVAQFMGLTDIPYYRNTFVIAAVNCAIWGKRKAYQAYSKIGLIQEMQKHSDACEFLYYKLYTIQAIQARKLCKSGMAAAVFNAYLSGYDINKLERFCNVVIYGICREKTEEPIIKLRDELLITKSKTREERVKMYNMTQSVLYAYANDKTTVDFKKADTEYYVYPDRKKVEDDGQLSLEL